jgi:hypothetical protein
VQNIWESSFLFVILSGKFVWRYWKWNQALDLWKLNWKGTQLKSPLRWRCHSLIYLTSLDACAFLATLVEEHTWICTEKLPQPFNSLLYLVEAYGQFQSRYWNANMVWNSHKGMTFCSWQTFQLGSNVPVVCIAIVKEGDHPIEFGHDVDFIPFDATWTL